MKNQGEQCWILNFKVCCLSSFQETVIRFILTGTFCRILYFLVLLKIQIWILVYIYRTYNPSSPIILKELVCIMSCRSILLELDLNFFWWVIYIQVFLVSVTFWPLWGFIPRKAKKAGNVERRVQGCLLILVKPRSTSVSIRQLIAAVKCFFG